MPAMTPSPVDSTPSSSVVRTPLVHALTAAVLLGCLAIAGCKGAPDGQAKGKEGDKKEEKAQEAVPVEVVAVANRPVAASYSGTAPLEAPYSTR